MRLLPLVQSGGKIAAKSFCAPHPKRFNRINSTAPCTHTFVRLRINEVLDANTDTHSFQRENLLRQYTNNIRISTKKIVIIVCFGVDVQSASPTRL